MLVWSPVPHLDVGGAGTITAMAGDVGLYVVALAAAAALTLALAPPRARRAALERSRAEGESGATVYLVAGAELLGRVAIVAIPVVAAVLVIRAVR